MKTSVFVLLLFALLGGLASCVSLHGSYVPVEGTLDNPHYRPKEVRYYSPITQDTVRAALVENYEFGRPRPYEDTIEFLSGNLIRANSRPNYWSSCSYKTIKIEEKSYTLDNDTLKSDYVRYLVRGDTLYPLHNGAIYVKE